MGTLRITLLGAVRVSHSEGSERSLTRVPGALLAYLLVHGHRNHSREAIAAALWPESGESGARSCLSTTLHRLREVLKPDGTPRETYLITTPAGDIGFNWESEHWIDADLFERKATQVLASSVATMDPADVHDLDEAVCNYTGELLEGVYYEWALSHRRRLELLRIDALRRLMDYQRDRGAVHEALSYGRRVLERDPLQEQVHREMMELYLGSGQRALACRQYQLCKEILLQELGAAPSEATEAVYARVVANGGPRRRHVRDGEAEAVEHPVARLDAALAAIRHLRDELDLVERLFADAAILGPAGPTSPSL